MLRIAVLVLALMLPAAATAAAADERRASLRGSAATMREQNRVARQHGLTFFATTRQIDAAVSKGALVELSGNDDYDVAGFVRLPYAVPAVRTFVERLSEQYHASCGQKLVVTSAVRPSTRQPSNASRLSVHPAGMAVDLRVSDSASCRQWLESAILSMERRGVINGIREFNPPHYHIAIYPDPYLAYVDERIVAEREEAEATARAEAEARAGALSAANEADGSRAAAEANATAGAATSAEAPRPKAILPPWVGALLLGVGGAAAGLWWLTRVKGLTLLALLDR